MKNKTFLLALHSVEGLGSVRLKRLIEYYGDPKIIWEKSNKNELRSLGIPEIVFEKLNQSRRKIDPFAYAAKIEQSGIKIMILEDTDYPEGLKQIYDPPFVIYYWGEFNEQDARAIAIVGTRKMTGYGKAVTEKFTSELVEQGFTIVSGLARGVDTVAHTSALKAGGRTIAVLGGGLRKMFPPENTALAEKIATGHGVVMSEFPPDYPSLAGNFPARNRIVAGLSLGVLVTEADQDSGSLITARLGIDQGKEVFAVPGPITSNLSKGPSVLIKDGAKLTFETQDILDELGVMKKRSMSGVENNLTDSEKQILAYLESERHIDEICRDLRKQTAEIAATMIKLEISGLVKNIGSGVYCRIF